MRLRSARPSLKSSGPLLIFRVGRFLPHYRYNRFITQTPSGGIVRMCCVSSRINVRWVSEYRIDTANRQLHFLHRQSTLNATRGMKVIWDFQELPGGFVHVTINHRHEPKWTVIGQTLTGWVAGRLFIREQMVTIENGRRCLWPRNRSTYQTRID